MPTFDFLQGARYVRDTLLNTPPVLLPEVIRNLATAVASKPAEYAAGMRSVLDEVKPK